MNERRLIVILGIITYCRCTQSNPTAPVSPLFQCQSLSEESELVYTPNIPDFYFNDSNAARFTRGGGNHFNGQQRNFPIFIIPSELNCIGKVVSMQYCYWQSNVSNTGKFHLISFNQDGQKITFSRIISFKTTTPHDKCTNFEGDKQVCCDVKSLSAIKQFQIPSTYIFGIKTKHIRPLFFNDSDTEYLVERSYIIIDEDEISTSYKLWREDKFQPLPLLRFIISR